MQISSHRVNPQQHHSVSVLEIGWFPAVDRKQPRISTGLKIEVEHYRSQQFPIPRKIMRPQRACANTTSAPATNRRGWLEVPRSWGWRLIRRWIRRKGWFLPSLALLPFTGCNRDRLYSSINHFNFILKSILTKWRIFYSDSYCYALYPLTKSLNTVEYKVCIQEMISRGKLKQTLSKSELG